MTKTPTSVLPAVDVELIIEGSYPFVAGGVSSWVQRLMARMPDLSFGITHIGSQRKSLRKLKYKLPENVSFLQNVYLFDPVFVPAGDTGVFPFELWSADIEKPSMKKGIDHILGIDDSSNGISGVFSELSQFHEQFHSRSIQGFSGLLKKMTDDRMIPVLRRLYSSREAFSLVIRLYQKLAAKSSFLDFFWTWRLLHVPLLQLLQTRPVKARICHAVSTGFAGFLGTLRKITQGIPLLLTEHGIYTRERAIEITHADWIFKEAHPEYRVRRAQGTFKRMWMSYFQTIGLWTYQASDRIITLNQGNYDAQIILGAVPEKLEIIPNGISMEAFLDLRSSASPSPHAFRVGFIGRVVMIKDVRTFLRAAKIVLMEYPDAMFSVIGPLDEEPEYAEEMQALTHMLRIENRVEFLGKQNVREYFPKLDVNVLTSISEAQPLTLLEGMAAGLPCVATDVGSCRELIFGCDQADRELGECGIITSLRSPAQTAQAIIDICTNPPRYQKMVQAGKTRVKTYYQEKDIYGRYRRLYEDLGHVPPARFMNRTGATTGKARN
ncbi:MAG: GT4 family glycosyltransferase PelF [Candidatus Riflebacteria bacterium]|nr:GT4 family glycosyltransferase PelF [Candidatus Riflebacteria bacterium]